VILVTGGTEEVDRRMFSAAHVDAHSHADISPRSSPRPWWSRAEDRE